MQHKQNVRTVSFCCCTRPHSFKMPRRKRYKSRGRKRRYRRKSRAVMRRTKRLRTLQPKRLYRSLIYASNFNLNVTASGFPVFYHFSANGLFDPDLTGAGHQPMGFDQIMPLYNNYVVISASITCTFSGRPSDASTNSIQMVGIKNADSVHALSVLSTSLIEQRKINYKFLNWNSGGSSVKTVKQHQKSWKMLGLSSPFSDVTYRGSVSGNPATFTEFLCLTGPLDNVTDTTLLNCQARIVYHCCFINPQTDLAES